jgi:NADH-ubiquinone oxidoreductase B18 subunit (NDUFB7)
LELLALLAVVFGRDIRRLTLGHSTQDERHSYEKCQYEEFKKRVKKMEELRAANGGRSGLN